MEDYLKQRERERKREYFRRYRAAHPEKYKAALMRYYTKKAAEARSMDPAADTTPTATVAGEGTIA